MISVVIATQDDERTLGAVLAALVPAAVDALVREVIVVDAGSSDRTLEIADDAGARILKAGGVAEGCALARSDWLLILNAKTAPPPGWEALALDHIREHGDQAGWWGRAGPLGFGGKPDAVLAPKALAGAAFAGVLGRRSRRIKLPKA